MNCWILQGNSNDYSWKDQMKEHNDLDTWGINPIRFRKYIEEIERGDTAFIWLTKYKGKETRGIYAVAEITHVPDKKIRRFAWEHQYWINPESERVVKRFWRLELRYRKLFINNYIRKDKLVAAGLDLLILKMPQAGIYKLTQEECETIMLAR